MSDRSTLKHEGRNQLSAGRAALILAPPIAGTIALLSVFVWYVTPDTGNTGLSGHGVVAMILETVFSSSSASGSWAWSSIPPGADTTRTRHSGSRPATQRSWGAEDDLCRHGGLHPLQVHRLRRGLPCRLSYMGENMLVTHPDEWIDCGVCEPECPVDAIIPDTERAADKWLDLNREYAAKWPNISRTIDPRPMPTNGKMCSINSKDSSVPSRASREDKPTRRLLRLGSVMWRSKGWPCRLD